MKNKNNRLKKKKWNFWKKDIKWENRRKYDKDLHYIDIIKLNLYLK